MSEVYFKLKGIYYIVKYKDKKSEIYKKMNDMIVQLSNEEKTILESNLNKDYNYIYDNEVIYNLIQQNKNIEEKEYIGNFLNWLVQLIPVQYREKFYKNIKTLNTTLNIDIDLSNSLTEITNGYSACGGYNTRDNTLVIPLESLISLKKISQKSNNPDEFYWRSYSQTLLHELAHMASSKYDIINGKSLCGFDTFPPNDEEDKNRGLTEGFTEIISMAGVPNTVEIASGYYVEALLINQLIQIIGNPVFLESYFGNLGIKPLKEQLNMLINDENKSYELFRKIELNYQIRHFDEKQNVLGNIQFILLDYYEKKLDDLLQQGKFDDIKNSIQIYEQMLVTPNKFVIMRKNPDNYVGLDESLTRFENIKQKYLNVLINKNDSHHR